MTDAEVVFHLAAQADVGTSVHRPGFDARGQRRRHASNVLEAARATGAHVVFVLDGRRDLRRRRRACPRGRAAPPRLCRTGSRSASAEVYVDGWNRVYGPGHVVLRFANVYGPRQSAALEGGVVAIFLERLRAGEATAIFGDGHADARLRARGRRRPCALARGRGVAAASSTSAPASRRRSPSSTRSARRRSAMTAPPRHDPPRPGDARPQRARPVACDARRSASRPQIGLAEGHRRDLGVDPDRAERGQEGVAPGRAKLARVVDHPITLEHVDLPSARGARRRSSRRRRGRRARRPGRRGRRADRQARARAVHEVAPPPAAAPRSRERAADDGEAALATQVTKRTRRPSSRGARSRSSSSTATATREPRQSTASRVHGRGYRIGVVGNAPSHDYPRSLVMYRRGFEGEGTPARA